MVYMVLASPQLGSNIALVLLLLLAMCLQASVVLEGWLMMA